MLLWYSEFYWRTVGSRDRSNTDMLVCRARWAREFIRWTGRHPIVGAGKWQFNDVLYAEVPLWCASGPIARRWIVPTCVWKLSDYKNWSECWKIATRDPVEEFYRSWCSETVRVGRVRVFKEFLTVFNCSVLTLSAIKSHREYNTRVRYNMNQKGCHLNLHKQPKWCVS
jgi:hypothetical protein